jgi:DNA-binding CsgD family transcriptional regulator
LRRKEKQASFSAKNPGLDLLSPAERKVLRLIADSRTSKQIAEELFLSPKTVDNYRFRISEKLNIRGSYSLLKFALENKSLL